MPSGHMILCNILFPLGGDDVCPNRQIYEKSLYWQSEATTLYIDISLRKSEAFSFERKIMK